MFGGGKNTAETMINVYFLINAIDKDRTEQVRKTNNSTYYFEIWM